MKSLTLVGAGGISAEGECASEGGELTGVDIEGVTYISGWEEVGDTAGDMRSFISSSWAARRLGSMPWAGSAYRSAKTAPYRFLDDCFIPFTKTSHDFMCNYS